MDSSGEIINLCRLCLVEDRVNIPIFDDPDDNARQISLKINSCLPVKISRNDNLPKKICDGCSEKLDLCYEFRNSSAAAEKKLLSMVGEKANQFDEPPVPQPMLLKEDPELTESIPSEPVVEEENDLGEPPVPKPMLVKEEDEAPPAKRPRRSAAIKAQMNILPESDDEAGTADDLNPPEPISKEEDESDYNEDHTEAPDTSIDDAQPGPSGLNQGSADSTVTETIYLEVEDPTTIQVAEKAGDPPRLLHWCHICGKCFNRKPELNKHFAFVHFGDKRHHCKLCGASYKEEESLLNHIRRNHKPPARVQTVQTCLCHECGAIFKGEIDLERHRADAHSRITCEWCHEDFDTEAAFKKHFKEHTREIVKHCHLCREPFNSMSRYRYHMRTNHTDTFLLCRYCSKLFATEGKLRQHENLHRQVPKQKEIQECPVCQKCVKHLKVHMATVHSLVEQGCVCHLCGARFKLGSYLRRHMAVHASRKKTEA